MHDNIDLHINDNDDPDLNNIINHHKGDAQKAVMREGLIATFIIIGIITFNVSSNQYEQLILKKNDYNDCLTQFSKDTFFCLSLLAQELRYQYYFKSTTFLYTPAINALGYLYIAPFFIKLFQNIQIIRSYPTWNQKNITAETISNTTKKSDFCKFIVNITLTLSFIGLAIGASVEGNQFIEGIPMTEEYKKCIKANYSENHCISATALTLRYNGDNNASMYEVSFAAIALSIYSSFNVITYGAHWLNKRFKLIDKCCNFFKRQKNEAKVPLIKNDGNQNNV